MGEYAATVGNSDGYASISPASGVFSNPKKALK